MTLLFVGVVAVGSGLSVASGHEHTFWLTVPLVVLECLSFAILGQVYGFFQTYCSLFVGLFCCFLDTWKHFRPEQPRHSCWWWFRWDRSHASSNTCSVYQASMSQHLSRASFLWINKHGSQANVSEVFPDIPLGSRWLLKRIPSGLVPFSLAHLS